MNICGFLGLCEDEEEDSDLPLLPDFGVEGCKIFRNFGVRLPYDTVSYGKITEFSNQNIFFIYLLYLNKKIIF
jgi:hypothetical protein